jgi:YidC/Oxa1 family membrane protein insertase
MEQRRLILFIVLSMTILFGWSHLVLPLLVPPPPEAPAPAEQLEQAADDGSDERDADTPPGEDRPDQFENAAEDLAAGDRSAETVQQDGDQVATTSNGETSDDEEAAGSTDRSEKPQPPAADGDRPQLPERASREIVLGSSDPETGYFLRAVVSTRGAVLLYAEMSDPHYRELHDRQAPLKIVGHTATPLHTFATMVDQIDGQLAAYETNLNAVVWEVVEEKADRADKTLLSAVTLRYTAPQQDVAVRKRYELKKIDVTAGDPREIRDTTVDGYLLNFAITIENLTSEKLAAAYELQGPVGVPLENVENTRRYRTVQMGFLEPNGGINSDSLAAGAIADAVKKNEPLEEWKAPLKFIGVDVQYFAALIIPGGDQLTSPFTASSRAMLVTTNVPAERSDISVRMESGPIPLLLGDEVTHNYKLFLGPKRGALLEPIGAAGVLDYGWIAFISKPMIALLTFLYNSWGFNYGIAIICLTVIVRGCMYPISKKQALSAKKMKELQPQINELRKKYANEKEKLAKAQMELFGKHNWNPLAGCLPLFLQFPIFIGLYNALNGAVDLRMASFLYIDNLAAPDALFALPFVVPIVGWQDFNLLPLLTVGLFVLQQKMFMPPPAPDDEQAQMQHKMMQIMMIVMGFFFYRVPAGLCVYFIASSLWGMGERKLLDFSTGKSAPAGDAPGAEGKPPGKPPGKVPDKPKPPKKDGLWGRLVASADAAAAEQSKSNGKSRADKSSRKSKSKQKKSKSRRR